ncbi:hypothetical protein BT96DRAFT_1007328 [Gymnopus androsaceus JB14]|uniref:NGN domain-containing protein n=1 Tax=Gymnopus androsaceus JB14 TaxID=1447944 RepID=A0A6A4GI55_9AGAR|nr:hypothetical protein BT96DRAFT_1007328 [Gymnopus androsaceus JB14]
MINQCIDLEAQVASNDEFSDIDGFEDRGFIDDSPVNSPGPSSPTPTSPSSTPLLATTRNKGLNTLLARIEDHLTQKPLPEEEEDESVLGQKGLWLREGDRSLWRPRQEYHVIFELISKHEVLHKELSSAFYNPRDVGYVYLEARFSKSGPQSLREVLRGLYNTKMSTLALVPESELKKCLHMQDERGYAHGQWVQIRGVKVLVVPRLSLAASNKHYASSSKRKRDAPCPPSELFQPAKCKHDLVKRGDRYMYKSWTFKHGLLVKVFNLSSVSPARKIPISLFHLFSESKKRAGKDLFEIASMPLPSFWHFDPGEKVIVHYKEGATFGTVLTSEEESDMEKSWCVVDVVSKGHQRVMVRYLEKNIIPGDFIEVLRGAHTGKSGFVVAKTDDHLGICIGAYFRVHANSVKLTTPNYSNTETPWLNVEVKLLIQPHAGQTGWVKDVFVDSNRSLQLVVYLCTGKTCTVGHSEVLERWTGKLLLDHQPLKPHQSQFDVDVPWKDVEVVIQSGSFVSSIGIVKDVRRDFRGSLHVLLWIVQHNCSVEVDHSTVMERRTFMPLLESLPLHDHQLTKVQRQF